VLIDAGFDFPSQSFGIAAYFACAAFLAGIAGRKVDAELSIRDDQNRASQE
jgi:hypothetical protein